MGSQFRRGLGKVETRKMKENKRREKDELNGLRGGLGLEEGEGNGKEERRRQGKGGDRDRD